MLYRFLLFFFFNDTATTEIYTLSLHDALPILVGEMPRDVHRALVLEAAHEDARGIGLGEADRAQHPAQPARARVARSEEHTSELQSPDHLVCRLLLEKKKTKSAISTYRCTSHD